MCNTSESIKNVLAQLGIDTNNVQVTITNSDLAPVKKTFSEIIREFGLNNEQVEFLQLYSRERSRKRYEIFAATKIGDNELVKDWVYDGFWDSGEMGNEHCSLGHALRYVHVARNIKTNETIKFGIKCVQDFFSLTDAQIKLLKQGFAEANEEVQSVLDLYIQFNGDFDKYEEKYHTVEMLNYILDTEPLMLKFSVNDVENLLILGLVKNYLKLRLPVPRTFFNTIIHYFIAIKKLHERAANEKRNEDLVEEEINKSEELKGIFSYLKENYNKLYKIAINIFPHIKKGNATEKQIKLYTKIISVDWNRVNIYVNAIRKNPEKCTNGYYREICENIINNIPDYGISTKQLNVLQRSYNLPK